MPLPSVTPVPVPDRRSSSASPLTLCAAAWFVPGAGHLLQGRTEKAVVFFVVLVGMFTVGLAFGGRLFPFRLAEPLVFLAAAAEWVLGLPRLVAALGGFGAGDVIRVTYEYGNTFLIAAGLLNALVVLDVYDLAIGRRR
ncbi:MAG TPA: DUF6677 family protein [Vicinamibacterales bacterium]|jgi:hypothetical protein|nr:DUF6677 family protein [Vicinamibacterales bacterium]